MRAADLRPQRLPRAITDGLVLTAGMALLWLVTGVFQHVPGEYAINLLLVPSLLLVLGAYAGRAVEYVRLPRLTGFILIGTVVGPHLLGWVGTQQVTDIKLVNDLAIGVIALMAGAEIQLEWLRARLRSIIALVASQTLIIPAVEVAVVLALADHIPFVGAAEAAGVAPWLPAALIGILALANSPMVVVSVIRDNHARGPISETAMGVAVLKDVVDILIFTILASLAVGTGVAGTSDILLTGFEVIGRILLSVVLGLGIGLALGRYTSRSNFRLAWLVVALALVVALLEPLLHVEPLFCLLAAGFACENLAGKRSAIARHRLDRALGQVASPVFVIFFVAAGLGLDLDTLMHGWYLVLILVLSRAAAVFASVRVGCALVETEPSVRRWLWTGMIPQAGITIALASTLKDLAPTWGPLAADLVIAGVACHEVIGPVIFTLALKRSGEADRAAPADHDHAH